ncbi:hypothetical protein MPTK1_6g16730 [Marchantia polymorpha subsp. ruderalis]|uniref:Uncharacterized protein n=2 Tax=Marchantia polymorpha TaxID=3197 RepID=A0AAF6BST7_MARPO|nr:hypothetical protein MARPO_0170s0004 [Marchantia polymorpha]BBN15071.1 hypothetical protein Mp_6g16730 [Marchantia polymorpha subsp. ruderalis]|eukprot:PTQ28196.1 hypothetical protein MARPO_0170s0004 [Marchantia polymorpha]
MGSFVNRYNIEICITFSRNFIQIVISDYFIRVEIISPTGLVTISQFFSFLPSPHEARLKSGGYSAPMEMETNAVTSAYTPDPSHNRVGLRWWCGRASSIADWNPRSGRRGGIRFHGQQKPELMSDRGAAERTKPDRGHTAVSSRPIQVTRDRTGGKAQGSWYGGTTVEAEGAYAKLPTEAKAKTGCSEEGVDNAPSLLMASNYPNPFSLGAPPCQARALQTCRLSRSGTIDGPGQTTAWRL